MKLPYTVLLDPVTGKGAAYTSTHRLITENASRKLVEFAQARHVQKAPWSPKEHRPESAKHPLPAWATPEVLSRVELLWVRTDGSDDLHLRALPRK